MLRLASDADVHGGIVRGLRRRAPGIDLVRAQDALPEGGPTPKSWPGARQRIES
jgi:hypothetical protein